MFSFSIILFIAARTATNSSRLPSLRRQLTNKRFQEAYKNRIGFSTNHLALNDNAEQSPNDVTEKQTTGTNKHEEQKQTFPSISPGKRSLVGSDNVERFDELLKKDIGKILSSSAHYISI